MLLGLQVRRMWHVLKYFCGWGEERKKVNVENVGAVMLSYMNAVCIPAHSPLHALALFVPLVLLVFHSSLFAFLSFCIPLMFPHPSLNKWNVELGMNEECRMRGMQSERNAE
jgi:hypothetical protein